MINVRISIQWNPSCEATPFAFEKWPFKRVGLSSGVKINTYMFRFTLSSGLSREGRLPSGWPLKRGFTVVLYVSLFLRKQCLECGAAMDHLSCRISIKMASQPCGGIISNTSTQYSPRGMSVQKVLANVQNCNI